MKKLILTLLILALAGVCFGKDCRVMAGGYEVFLVKAGSAAMSQEQRAEMIQSKVVTVLSNPRPAMRLEEFKDGSIKIWAGSIPICTVGERDAKAGPDTIKSIADKWSAAILKTYDLAKARDVNIPKKEVKLKGKKRTRKYHGK